MDVDTLCGENSRFPPPAPRALYRSKAKAQLTWTRQGRSLSGVDGMAPSPVGHRSVDVALSVRSAPSVGVAVAAGGAGVGVGVEGSGVGAAAGGAGVRVGVEGSGVGSAAGGGAGEQESTQPGTDEPGWLPLRLPASSSLEHRQSSPRIPVQGLDPPPSQAAAPAIGSGPTIESWGWRVGGARMPEALPRPGY